MQNPLLQNLSQSQRSQLPTQMSVPNNPIQMYQQFMDFKKQMAGKNPQQMVNDLLASGQMSQSQYTQLAQQAQNLLTRFK